jgi:hypothetical protein
VSVIVSVPRRKTTSTTLSTGPSNLRATSFIGALPTDQGGDGDLAGVKGERTGCLDRGIPPTKKSGFAGSSRWNRGTGGLALLVHRQEALNL